MNDRILFEKPLRQGEVLRAAVSEYERGHVPPYDRTYFAQHGRDCPFQVWA